MVKEGGSEDEAKKLAGEFQELLLEVMFEKKEIDEENEIIAAKALPGTKKKKPANLPNEFITNDDFCPGCGLELKSLPTDRMQLWVDAFQRDLGEGEDPAGAEYVKPGLLMFRGWGLERQLSADRRKHVEELRADIKSMHAARPPQFTYVHGVRDVGKPENLKLAIRGNPMKLGEEVRRGFLAVLSEREPAPFTAFRLSRADDLRRAAVQHARSAAAAVPDEQRLHAAAGGTARASHIGRTGHSLAGPQGLPPRVRPRASRCRAGRGCRLRAAGADAHVRRA
jgi:hypothetical protein